MAGITRRSSPGGAKEGAGVVDPQQAQEGDPVAEDEIFLEVGERRVRLSHPGKIMFPDQGWTKLDVALHYIRCSEGAMRGVAGRPLVLKRWPDGAGGEPFFQKRAPKPEGRKERGRAGPGSQVSVAGRGSVGGLPEPPHEYATVRFFSGRSADLLVARHSADIVWLVQLDCLDLNPWPVRAEDVDHPDELRVDLDPTQPADFAAVREVALACKEILERHGLAPWPKTSGSRGIHLAVRIEPRWPFDDVRRAALALAREAERVLPGTATAAWWKEERHGVFVDYNQNARDRTIASAYSVRQTGLVSTPLRWTEVPSVRAEEFRLDTFSERYAEVGDITRGIDDTAGRLDGLLRLAAEQAAGGQGEAPWPPHYPKRAGEPRRAQPSRRRRGG